MRSVEIRVHRLSQMIMQMQAREVARSKRAPGEWGYFYDPLAATCLGELILTIIRNPAARQEERKEGE